MKKWVVLFYTAFVFIPVHGAESTEMNRPKVGVVLGGGGALGMAHVGVLRVLEEERVPIDYICGTSMGAIIAGLYASGMSPDEIEAFLTGLDWNQVMSDKTPRRELFFRRKLEDQRYLLTMGLGPDGLKMGTGMAAGQKFNNLLQLQVQRSARITDFDQLPIPYRAVATDLVSGGPLVLDQGNLTRAMRASMAVPGVFTAVEIDGHLLVDGGIVNNLPVEVAREMGAEIIIAVDVGAASDKVDPAKLRSIPGILSRTYAIAQRPEQVEQFRQADIGMQPELSDFTASQFARVAELIPKGEESARAKASELRTLSVSPAAYRDYLARQRRAPLGTVRLDAVNIIGNERVSEKNIQGRIYSEPGQPFDAEEMQQDLMRIYGIGEFEQVLYHLEQSSEEAGTLNYEVTEDPAGPLYLSVGLHLRSDFQNDTDWNILLNLTRRSINRVGAEWRNEAVLGVTQAYLSEFYQPLGHGGNFFVAPTVDYRSVLQDLYDNENHIATYDVTTSEARFDFGIQLRSYAELRVGPVWGNGQGEVDIGIANLPEFNDDYAGPAIRLTVDRKDRTYFPREGYYFETRGFFPMDEWGGDVSYEKIAAEFSLHQSVEEHTMEVKLQGGTDLNSGLPAYAQFTLGGPDSFSGLAQDQFRGSKLGVASLGYRYRLRELPSQLGNGVYAMTRFDMGNVWENSFSSDIRYGASVGVGVDLNIGPLLLTYGLADGGYQSIYFSLGSHF